MNIAETIDEKLFELKKQMEIASKLGVRGQKMCARIKGDLSRIMDSAWLNLDEFIDDSKQDEEV